MIRYLRPLCLLALGLYLSALPAIAQDVPPPSQKSGEDIVDISAQQSLEWHEDTRQYVARGEAKAVKGDLIVEADILTAHQPEKGAAQTQSASPNGTQSNVDLMTAEGNVRIHDTKQKVFGDKAVYDLNKGLIHITGNNLKYMTEKTIVTAKDSLEFDEKNNRATARGHAIGQNDQTRVEADILKAFFAKNAAGNLEMNILRAWGNVIIVTKDGGVSRGDVAQYDAKTDKALLAKNVRITRGKTQLMGSKAEVDFKTGQSRLLSGGEGRVHALLATQKDEKKENTKKEAP
ncbi:MAG: hypothetical protein EOM37_05105 [Proteobacteria bacterium]|jgi:lipopolysaccharide export system protein LptA|nr:LptA/OstA family protein [Alphaproteobacteria bacterium]NCC03410.1 hypothetical protein [Pseudomonadota bacterium]